ncbi:MAG: transcriptional regulator with XRE-family HTH domain [Yoonia sp.]
MPDNDIYAIEPKSDDGLGSRMRKLRHRMSMTLQQLSVASGVSVGYLSQVERGNATPTLGTLTQIAQALEVDTGYFIRAPRTVDSLTRDGARPKFALAGSSIEYEQIGAERAGHELTSYIINVPPGYASEVVHHVGEEIIYILEGEISQMVGEREYLMGAGDSLHYLGTTPHCWSNKTAKTARILWVGQMHFGKSNEIGLIENNRADNPREMLPLRRQNP